MGANWRSDPQERAEEHRTWWWKRTSSGKLLHPGDKYVLVKQFFDDMGRPPIKGLSWDRIYTVNEFLVHELTRNSKKFYKDPRGKCKSVYG